MPEISSLTRLKKRKVEKKKGKKRGRNKIRKGEKRKKRGEGSSSQFYPIIVKWKSAVGGQYPVRKEFWRLPKYKEPGPHSPLVCVLVQAHEAQKSMLSGFLSLFPHYLSKYVCSLNLVAWLDCTAASSRGPLAFTHYALLCPFFISFKQTQFTEIEK